MRKAEMHLVRPALNLGVIAFLVAAAASPRSYSQALTLSPDCPRLKDLGESNKQIKAQRDRIALGDRTQWCLLNKEQIASNNQMISIFEADPHRCGVRDEIVDNLKT
jgi:hypothetical protein